MPTDPRSIDPTLEAGAASGVPALHPCRCGDRHPIEFYLAGVPVVACPLLPYDMAYLVEKSR